MLENLHMLLAQQTRDTCHGSVVQVANILA